jgi:TetR/AcrR family transcriptional regulator, regulator of biofilm formation and stress response
VNVTDATHPLEPRDGDPVRRRILLAVLQIVADDGLDAVRHRRVAELAGVSLGSTSYHFASRDDLIEAAFDLYLDGAGALLDELDDGRISGGRADDPVAAVVGFVERLVALEFADPALVRAEYEMILHATRHPRLGERLATWEDARRRVVEQAFRSAGAPRPVDAARTLFALVRGIEVERLVHPDRVPALRRRLTPVVAALLGGRRPIPGTTVPIPRPGRG